ncbi:Hemin import ATP-binding protein HmuV [Planctomycetales bacterium 10988]|nr:Hemin import ATP-binding protein HmuV [Planctomycetales bacterium 10988]
MTELQAIDLRCGYGSRQVLERLSLVAKAGEVLGLLGPNGSGKTTLLRAMSRLLRPQGGQVQLAEKDLWEYRPSELARQMAVAPQSEQREWPLLVDAAIRLGRAAHRGWLMPYSKEDHQLVEEVLTRTGLVPLRDRPITELSGGEWRRVVLARALCQQPRALLLDEPIAGLDLKYQTEMLAMVQELAREEKLIVILTMHDLNQAALCADRIALLGEQSILSVGTPEEVLTAERIEKIYGVPVTVTKHPVYQTPLIAPLTSLRSPAT